jgi:hypothetical protein
MIYSPREEDKISKPVFFVGSLGAFSLGMFLGVKWIMKREQMDVAPNEKVVGMRLAGRALGLGTLLCLGSFAGIGALFIGATGITTVNEFGAFARGIVYKTGLQQLIEKVDPDKDKESKEVEQQLEQMLNDFWNPPPKVERSRPENEKSQVNGSRVKIIEEIREKLRRKFGEDVTKSSEHEKQKDKE